MPETDKEKRKRAHTEKRKKLQNPLFFVSATRLCVRNLKKSITDNQFRDLCIKAAKEGLATGKVQASDMDLQLASQGLAIRERPAEALVVPNLHAFMPGAAGTKKSTYLSDLKAKIMRDTSRIKDGSSDVAPSRGYGFVEFNHHGHALSCLRQLNNNPEYFDYTLSHSNQDPGKRSRLIVEFSLEDTRKVSLLKKRVDQVVRKNAYADKKGAEGGADSKKKDSKNKKKVAEKAAATEKAAAAEKAGKVQEKAESAVSPAPAAAPVNIKHNNKRKNKDALKRNKEGKKKQKQEK
jgi:nucleolar protein 4